MTWAPWNAHSEPPEHAIVLNLGGLLVNDRTKLRYGPFMVVDGQVLEAEQTKCDLHPADGVVFVRLLAPGCWVLTVDHRVFYIYRRQGRRVPSLGVRALDCPHPWSPDKGIA